MNIIDAAVDIVTLDQNKALVRFTLDRSCAAQIAMDHIMNEYEWLGQPTSREVTFIYPEWIGHDPHVFLKWRASCEESEEAFNQILNRGYSYEEAESVLPTSAAFTLNVRGTIGEWIDFLNYYLHDSTCGSMVKVAEYLLSLFQNSKVKDKFKGVNPEEPEDF